MTIIGGIFMFDHSNYINQLNAIQKAIASPAMQHIYEQTNHIAAALPSAAITSAANLSASLSPILAELSRGTEEIESALSTMAYLTASIQEPLQAISNLVLPLTPLLEGYTILNIHSPHRDGKEKETADSLSEKALSEIYTPDEEKRITNESPTMILLPANDNILAYLAEHPEDLYKCSPRDFEKYMAELYRKMGYQVELTPATRDGGKDIILRSPDILGDLVYYVECKQYNPNHKVGLDIVQRFTGVIEIDKANAGIIATTSFFSPDAQNWVINHDLGYRIKMHDFNTIARLLKRYA